MVKIRLKRIGKKHKPIYHIVVADSRSPRDGKFIDKLGIYNPNSNSSPFSIKIENTISWIKKGAIPTNTVKSILYKSGILFKIHLLKGIKKGSLSKNECINKFKNWIDKKKK